RWRWGLRLRSRAARGATLGNVAAGGARGGAARAAARLRRLRAERLAHQALDLGDLIRPALAAQEAQQRGIDRLRTLQVVHLAMGLGGLLTELQELVGFLARQRIQIDAVHRLVEVVGGVFQVALGAGALAERIVA